MSLGREASSSRSQETAAASAKVTLTHTPDVCLLPLQRVSTKEEKLSKKNGTFPHSLSSFYNSYTHPSAHSLTHDHPPPSLSSPLLASSSPLPPPEIIEDLKQFSVSLEARSSRGGGGGSSGSGSGGGSGRSSRLSVISPKGVDRGLDKFDSVHHLSRNMCKEVGCG